MAQKKQMLEDVVLLRLLLIFLLVWYHAFCPFTGAWSAIEGYPDSPFYYWCGKSLTLVRIQTLIFISGYLLGYNANRKPNVLTFNGCVVKKLKRLVLPSIIFSAVYYVIFYDLSAPWYNIVYSIINGCGHLWFLPMIFWCFVGVYIVEKLNIKPCFVVVIGVLASIFCVNIFPLRLGSAMSYFILFYLGYGIKRRYFNKLVNNIHLAPILCCALVYISGVIINGQMPDGFLGGDELIYIILGVISSNILHLIVSMCGILALYWLTHYFFIGKYKLPEWSITLSGYCYGVYICQQFILMYLYYNTDFHSLVGWQWLPWFGIIITVPLSLLLTHLMLKTKVGRFLIG